MGQILNVTSQTKENCELGGHELYLDHRKSKFAQDPLPHCSHLLLLGDKWQLYYY